MKKKILAIALIALTSFGAFAQVFGPTAGPLPPVRSGGGGAGGSITAGTAPFAAYYSAATVISSNTALQFAATELVVNETGSATMDLRVEGDINASLLFVDASQEAVFITRGVGTNPGDALTVTAGALANNKHGLTVTGTIGANAGAQWNGYIDTTTTVGSGSPIGLYAPIGGTYAGTAYAAGIQVDMSTVGTGTTPWSQDRGNFAIRSGASGTTAGANLGIKAFANNGAKNIGAYGMASGVGVGTTQVGVIGQAGIGASGSYIGGYFSLEIGEPLTNTVAALVADNGTVAANILDVRDNNTAVLTVADGGDTTIVPVASHAGPSLKITGGSVATGLGKNFLATSTLSTTAATQAANWFDTTSSTGGGAVLQIGVYSSLNAGYVAAGTTVAMQADNVAAGVGVAFVAGELGNYGGWFSSTATTVGTNVGMKNKATGSSTLNIGGLNTALTATAGTNVGSVNVAANGAVNVGGYFGLGAVDPTFVTTALQVSNGAIASSIAVFLDGTTPVLTIADGGVLTQEGGAVFNEGSASVDFRVETNNQASAFHINGFSDTAALAVPLTSTSTIAATRFDTTASQAVACASNVLALTPTASTVYLDANAAACVVTVSEPAAAFLNDKITIIVFNLGAASAVTFPNAANVLDGPTLCHSTGFNGTAGATGAYTLLYADLANDTLIGTSCIQNL